MNPTATPEPTPSGSVATSNSLAFTSRQRKRIIAVASGVPILFAAAGCFVMLAWLPRLPNPIAIHWDSAGNPDGFSSVAGNMALLFFTVLVAALGSAFVVATAPATALPSRTPKVLVSASVWLGVFLTIGIVGSVALQRDIGDAAVAQSPGLPVLIGAIVGGFLSVFAWLSVPEPALLDDDFDTAVSPLALAPNERVQFSATLRPGKRTMILLVLLPIAAIAIFAGFGTSYGTVTVIQSWWPIALGIAVLGVEAACLLWRVRIDSRGLLIRGILGFPRFIVGLDEIVSVRIVDVRPFAEFGGWGVRHSDGRVGIIVRAGTAVEVTRTDGKIIVFTIEQSHTAASALAGLIGRLATVRHN